MFYGFDAIDLMILKQVAGVELVTAKFALVDAILK